MVVNLIFCLWLINLAIARINVEVPDTAFNQQLYQDVLDSEECHRQVSFIRENTILGLQFADAGIRVPRGLLAGNSVDLGNYFQCLGINHNILDMEIQGKYCLIEVPMDQTFDVPPELEYTDWAQLKMLKDNEDLMKNMAKYNRVRSQIRLMLGINDHSRTLPIGPLSGTVLTLGVCVPKPCTTEQAMTSFIFNLTSIGFEYEDIFCRLPNDKPWTTADYIATAVFSVIGLLTILSTSYDLYYTFYVHIDRKKLNVLYTSFSVYTNGKRLMHFPAGAGNLQCLDGMRSLAMAWVIVGHTFGTYKFYMNSIDLFLWLTSLGALWISSGTITVDTFFTITGVLIVYTTAGKMDSMKLLKNLHLFYLNRLLRMFPILATVVLLQASFFHHVSDGPTWTIVSDQTNNCRSLWWSTLLHVQNLLNPRNLCISHSWYVAIDVQCYIFSPLVLFWILRGKRTSAWAGLIMSLLLIITASTVYNFIFEFQSVTVALSRTTEELIRYMDYYYFLPLTRAAPFLTGMLFGYVLHLYRNEKCQMPWSLAIFMWVVALGVTTTIFFHTYFIKQVDWDNQLADNLVNSFVRPAWAAALCWIIFACVNGYGGPVNWFLTLDIWKLPARLSYAMFLFHYPIMFVICDSTLSTTYFSVPWLTFQFFAHFALSVIVAFTATLIIDLPFATIFKKLLTPAPKPNSPTVLEQKRSEDNEKVVTMTDTTDVALLKGTNCTESLERNSLGSDGNRPITANSEEQKELLGKGKEHIVKEDIQEIENTLKEDTINKTQMNKSSVSGEIDNEISNPKTDVEKKANSSDFKNETDGNKKEN